MNMKNGWVLKSESLGLNLMTAAYQPWDCMTSSKFLALSPGVSSCNLSPHPPQGPEEH